MKTQKRPAWCKDQPDYWLREKERLKQIAQIKAATDSFTTLDAECRGCDYKIWEARKDDMVVRGCHCITISSWPGTPLYDFDLDQWSATVTTAAGMYEKEYRQKVTGGRN